MAVVLGWAGERGRGAARRMGERPPTGGRHPDLDYLGATVSMFQTFHGHCDIYSKARKRYNKTIPVTIL